MGVKKGNNITLIGMPGSGKSTVGVVVAKKLGYSFLDADLLIQEQENRLLWEIIEEEGRERFLEIEDSVCAGISADRTVISPGGSVIYGEKAMRHLAEIGTIVYLYLSLEDVEKRLGDLQERGVVLREGQTLKDLYEERTRLYEKYADVTVDETGKDIRETVREVIGQIVSPS